MFDKIYYSLGIVLGIYSFVVLFSLIKTVMVFPETDELEKKVFFETLSISMVVILVLHLLQLIYSMIAPGDFRPIISSGGHSLVRGIDGKIVHFDSFLFDCTVIAVVYNIRQLRYGLISKKIFLVKNSLLFLSIILFFILMILRFFN